MDAKLDPVRYSFKLLIASSTSCIYVLSGFARPVVLDDNGVDEAGFDGVFLLPSWFVATAVVAAFDVVVGDSTATVPSFFGVVSVLGCDGRFFFFLLVTVVVVVTGSSVVTVPFWAAVALTIAEKGESDGSWERCNAIGLVVVDVIVGVIPMGSRVPCFVLTVVVALMAVSAIELAVAVVVTDAAVCGWNNKGSNVMYQQGELQCVLMYKYVYV